MFAISILSWSLLNNSNKFKMLKQLIFLHKLIEFIYIGSSNQISNNSFICISFTFFKLKEYELIKFYNRYENFNFLKCSFCYVFINQNNKKFVVFYKKFQWKFTEVAIVLQDLLIRFKKMNYSFFMSW